MTSRFVSVILACCMVCLSVTQARAAIGIVDCQSVGDWAKHVGAAAAKIVYLGAEQTLGSPSLPWAHPKANSGDVGADIGLVLLNVYTHLNPSAVLEFVGAVVCVGNNEPAASK